MTLLDPAPALAHGAPLSVAMREGSQAQHEAAESSEFIEELMGGRVSAAGYVAYLRSLRPVYDALETVGATLAGHPVVGRLVDPALDRLAAIDADIDAWRTDAPEEHVAHDAAGRYASLIEATLEAPELYIAHHYTRYLGDLSGGQAIGRLLDREFGLEGRGLAFYDFPAIAKVKPYKDAYRATLDSLPLTPEQRSAVVAEVQRSFTANQQIFAALSAYLTRGPA